MKQLRPRDPLSAGSWLGALGGAVVSMDRHALGEEYVLALEFAYREFEKVIIQAQHLYLQALAARSGTTLTDAEDRSWRADYEDWDID